jgi:hypothetical protein
MYGQSEKKKNISVKSGRHEFSQFTYGQNKEKLSVKSGRHEFSLSSLMGKVKKKNISKDRET